MNDNTAAYRERNIVRLCVSPFTIAMVKNNRIAVQSRCGQNLPQRFFLVFRHALAGAGEANVSFDHDQASGKRN
jgi:hypothetical protein